MDVPVLSGIPCSLVAVVEVRLISAHAQVYLSSALGDWSRVRRLSVLCGIRGPQCSVSAHGARLMLTFEHDSRKSYCMRTHVYSRHTIKA